jgi:hypothetical protein
MTRTPMLLISLFAGAAAAAQPADVPGQATGQIDGAELSFPLDCGTFGNGGTLDGREIELPFSCKGWNPDGVIEVVTPADIGPSVDMYVRTDSRTGAAVVETEERMYQMAKSGIGESYFDVGEDSVRLAGRWGNPETDESYEADLTFDCSAR